MSPEQLPGELWVQILQHVDYKECLSACALVCQKLARAAAAATTCAGVRLESTERHVGFLSWTNSHGSSLTRLMLGSGSIIQNSYSTVRQLAAPHLVELDAGYVSVQLCAGREGLGLLHSCPALTRLALSTSVLLDDAVDAPTQAVPAAAAQLQHLDMVACRLPSNSNDKLCQAIADRLLPHLTSLTHLSLASNHPYPGLDLEPCSFLHSILPTISTVVSLQQLSLAGAGSVTPSSLPGIKRLSALVQLSLTACDVDPSALLSMATCLTSLKLEKVSLVPQQMQPDGTSRGARLLQLLARLVALQALQLDSVASDWPQQLSLFSALTASSDLQRLFIQDCGIEGEAWVHVLPAGRTLPNLRSLAVLRSREASAQEQQGHAVCSEAIYRLHSCCPGLEMLSVLLPPDVWLGSLQRLKSLTRLYLDNVERGALHELKTLTQLQDLELHAAPAAARGADLVQLVALTRLTQLGSCGAEMYRMYRDTDGVPCYEWDEPEDVVLQCFPSEGPPNVWFRLLDHCAADTAAQPAVIRSVLGQLQGQQRQVATARAEAAAAAARAAGAEAGAAALRARVQVLEERQEQQLAAARAEAAAEAAELRSCMQASEQRVQAVEGQLQKLLAALRQKAQA